MTAGGVMRRLVLPVLLVGVLTGLGGAAVSAVLRLLQHAAYGYSSGDFLEGAASAPPWVRVAALGAAGVLGAVGWWALRRWGRPTVSVEDAVAGRRMPRAATLATVGLQILVVGLGASIGRESAPRLLGGLAGDRLSGDLAADARLRRILIAAGAGAGLAAVYDVPLGGALFAVEVVLGEAGVLPVTIAIATSLIATLVARIVVTPGPLYTAPRIDGSVSLLVLSVVLGGVLGVVGLGFDRLAALARRRRVHGWAVLVAMPLVFLAVGATAIWLPEILGNGRALAQVAFGGGAAVALLVVLAIVKAAATAGTIWSGAEGGLLTPSVAMGAALGGAVATLWAQVWPGTSAAAGALVGGAAFLSATMRAPLTAGVLMLEFTGSGASALLPVFLAVAAGTAARELVRRLLRARREPPGPPSAEEDL
ncbi:chloride channel protein [Amnibacterium sp.]|uniref:chloride channel protein n=1 Tax=Amnibacterium sp. TaxID=1872496 RepID=UPI003F7C396F